MIARKPSRLAGEGEEEEEDGSRGVVGVVVPRRSMERKLREWAEGGESGDAATQRGWRRATAGRRTAWWWPEGWKEGRKTETKGRAEGKQVKVLTFDKPAAAKPRQGHGRGLHRSQQPPRHSPSFHSPSPPGSPPPGPPPPPDDY